MENSAIEWTDHTFNAWRGCTKVSPGCEHCYAETLSQRNPTTLGRWGPSGTRIIAVPDYWKKPVKWNAAGMISDCRYDHNSDGDCHIHRNGCPARRPRVFCASLADIFEDWTGPLHFPAKIAPTELVIARWNGHELVREWEPNDLPHATMDNARTELFRLIEDTPNLDWLLLTKRPQNVMRMVPDHWRDRFPDNIWIGTTVEDQQRADERIPHLLAIPAKVRFLSCEPLLGPVDLRFPCAGMHHGIGSPDCPRELHHHHDSRCVGRNIHWVIAGGESGPVARPMHPDWARGLRDQAKAAGVPFMFKQWGEWMPTCAQYPATESEHAEAEDCGLYGDIALYLNGKISSEGFQPSCNRTWLMNRVGKKAAGRKLDGIEHNAFPQPQSLP